MKWQFLSALCCAGLFFITAQTQAAVLIDMDLNEGSGTTAGNSGLLPDGTLIGSNRPDPVFTADSGVGNTGSAVTYTNEQTGRPNFHQSIDIASGGLDNLTAFTFATWWKSDAPINDLPASNTRMTLLSTKAGQAPNTAPGIYLGLIGDNNGPQIEVSMGDGVNGGQVFGPFNLSPRADAYDDDWNFIVYTFDSSITNALRVYVGDFNTPMVLAGVFGNLDSVIDTGDAADLISIGDGVGGFNAFSSFSGELDNIYFADTALSLADAEALRIANIPEPATAGLIGLGAMALLARRRRV